MRFLVNTDENNNYLYIEKFKVYLDGSLHDFDIPGLYNNIEDMFRRSDTNAFIQSSKFHEPFNVQNMTNTNFNSKTFNEFIDSYTANTPYSVKTFGKVKTYEIVLNPDDAATSAAEKVTAQAVINQANTDLQTARYNMTNMNNVQKPDASKFWGNPARDYYRSRIAFAEAAKTAANNAVNGWNSIIQNSYSGVVNEKDYPNVFHVNGARKTDKTGEFYTMPSNININWSCPFQFFWDWLGDKGYNIRQYNPDKDRFYKTGSSVYKLNDYNGTEIKGYQCTFDKQYWASFRLDIEAWSISGLGGDGGYREKTNFGIQRNQRPSPSERNALDEANNILNTANTSINIDKDKLNKVKEYPGTLSNSSSRGGK